jgi:hypothetical protein
MTIFLFIQHTGGCIVLRICQIGAKILLNTFILLGMSVFLMACSSGGGSSEKKSSAAPCAPTSAFPKITITEIGYGVREFYEGETVKVSLNAQGECKNNMTYQWRVEGNIPFTGQNTDTITFVAPTTEVFQSLDVEVSFGLQGGALIGYKDDRGTVDILDKDPPNLLRAGFATKLPSVAAIDFALFEKTGAWRIRDYQQSKFQIEGRWVDSQVFLEQIARSSSESANDFAVKICGSATEDSIKTKILLPPANVFSCDAALISRKFYQDAGVIRSETYCNNKLVGAVDMEKLSTEVEQSFGEIRIKQDSTGLLASTKNVCANKSESNLYYYDENIASPYKYVDAQAASALVVVEQANDSIIYQFTQPYELWYSSHNSLYSNLDASVTLVSKSVAGNLHSSRVEGSFSYERKTSNQDEYLVEMDLTFADKNGVNQKVSGEIDMSFH